MTKSLNNSQCHQKYHGIDVGWGYQEIKENFINEAAYL